MILLLFACSVAELHHVLYFSISQSPVFRLRRQVSYFWHLCPLSQSRSIDATAIALSNIARWRRQSSVFTAIFLIIQRRTNAAKVASSQWLFSTSFDSGPQCRQIIYRRQSVRILSDNSWI
jgi:hypothetical protein